jgi:hypothetical protein
MVTEFSAQEGVTRAGSSYRNGTRVGTTHCSNSDQRPNPWPCLSEAGVFVFPLLHHTPNLSVLTSAVDGMDCATAIASRRAATTGKISPCPNPRPTNDLRPNLRRGQKFLLHSATEYYTNDHTSSSERGAGSGESSQYVDLVSPCSEPPCSLLDSFFDNLASRH